MRSYIPWTLTLIFVLTNIYLIVKLLKEKEIKSENYENNDKEVELKIESLGYFTNGTQFSSEGSLEYSTDSTITLRSEIKNKLQNKTIFRFLNNTCFDCFHYQIQEWNKLIEENPQIQPIVLVHFENPNDFNIFRKNNKIKGEIYNTRNFNIHSISEKYGSPYIFTISKNYEIINPFIISKNLNREFKNYIDYLYKKK